MEKYHKSVFKASCENQMNYLNVGCCTELTAFVNIIRIMDPKIA